MQLMMKAMTILIIGLFSVFAHGKTKSSAPVIVEFHEQCSANPISHKQARWNCTNRGYRSEQELLDSLKERFQRGEWTRANSDTAFINLKDKDVWWDCKPREPGACGYWVRIANSQYLFLQQLLDREHNNKWLGIGITTFCGGKKVDCDRLIALAQSVLDPATDFSSWGSSIGPAPPSPPPPPGYKPAP